MTGLVGYASELFVTSRVVILAALVEVSSLRSSVTSDFLRIQPRGYALAFG